MSSTKNNFIGFLAKQCPKNQSRSLGAPFNLGKNQLRKSSVLYLWIRVLVICSLLSFSTADLQSMVVARQKQNLVTLVKKHPVVSIIIVGGVVWLVYKMTKNYRERGHLMAPPQCWPFSRNRNGSRGDNWPAAEKSQATQWQPHVVEPSSSPRSSSIGSSENRSMNHTGVEREISRPAASIQGSDIQQNRIPENRDQFPVAHVVRREPRTIPPSTAIDMGPMDTDMPGNMQFLMIAMQEVLSRNLADTPQLPVRVLHNPSGQQTIGQVNNDMSYQSFACEKERAHFEAVIKRGTAEEQDALGDDYLHGTAGLKQDMANAFRLFAIAASRGLPRARHNLGHCYFNGFGVAQDFSKAFEIFDALDKQGVAAKETQFYLGLCFLCGNGVRKNFLEALHYFRNAADNGDAEGQLLMSRMLYKGIIVSKDASLANSYFERAKQTLGSGPAARTKFNECKLHTLFVKPDVTKNCVGEQCCICAGGRPPFRLGDFISILPCKHYFCQDCIARWFEEKTSCPLCRRVVQMQQVVAGTAV